MSKNPINQIYLQLLLCFTRRRLDVLDSAKEDVVAAEQLLQLQPLLDLLPEDLKDVRGGSSARANIPSSESPWSAFPWFLQLLARVATMVATEIASHQQVLAGAERVSQVGESGVGIPHVLVLLHSLHSTLPQGGEQVFDQWQVVVVHLLDRGGLKQLLLLRLHGSHHLCVVGVVQQRVCEASLGLA